MTLPGRTLADLFPFAVELLGETMVTIKRLDAFLKLPESPFHDRGFDSSDEGRIEVLGGTFGWCSTTEEKRRTKAKNSNKKNTSSPKQVSLLRNLVLVHSDSNVELRCFRQKATSQESNAWCRR